MAIQAVTSSFKRNAGELAGSSDRFGSKAAVQPSGESRRRRSANLGVPSHAHSLPLFAA